MRQGCLLLILWLPSLAWGDSGPWRGIYYHVAVNEPLADLLQGFAADQGIPIVVSEQVAGVVSGKFGPVHPQSFLEEIAESNGLVWYFDGNALYVYDSSELRSELISVRGARLQETLDAFEQLGVVSEKFPIQTLPERGLLYVNGPPRYVELLSELASSIGMQAARQARVEIEMKMFPLQYAWADDQTLLLGGNQVYVPGVATILNQLVNPQAAAQGPVGRTIEQLPYTMPGLRGRGLMTPENRVLAHAQRAATQAEVSAARASAREQAITDLAGRESAAADSAKSDLIAAVQPIIQPDPRLNAIIIRDAKARMPHYAQIIRQLDQPGGLVQIEAAIIDVDADEGLEFGPPYLAQWRHGGSDHQLNFSLSDLAPNLTVSLMRDEVVEFLAQMRALETEGHAKLISRPSVLTVNNVEAILTNQEEFFVRIAGLEQVDLFNVNVGTVLRIIPHIVKEGARRRVKLVIHIEDGRRRDDTVDDIPVISRNSINTQAVLNEGASLLIGGLFREEVVKSERRIPYLGSVPYLGKLFTEIDYEKRRTERMVLITPKIIDLPPIDAGFGLPVDDLSTFVNPMPDGHSQPTSPPPTINPDPPVLPATPPEPTPPDPPENRQNDGTIHPTSQAKPSNDASILQRIKDRLSQSLPNW